MGFFIVLKIVLTMMAYLLCGYAIVKSGRADTSHAKSMSTLLIYICGPCMVINAFLNMQCTRANNISILSFFLVTMALQAAFFGIVYFFIRKKISDPKYRILSIGGVLGNVGFFGLPLVTGLFPSEPVVGGYSSIYVMSMNIIVFSIGVFMITGDRKYMSLRAIICNPTTIAIFIAMPLYILGVQLPTAAADGVSLMGKMTTPLCMIVLGMRLASSDLKAVFTRPFAYVASALKLLAYPLFAYLAVLFMPWFDNTFKICILVLSAAPTGAIVLSLSEIHECEQELSANVVLLTTLLSVITAPLIMMFVV